MHIKVDIDLELPRWAKKLCIYGGIPAAVLLGSSALVRADVTLPHSFSSGETLTASDLNANFEALRDEINASWDVSGNDVYYEGGNVGIGTASPSEALEVSSGGDGTQARFGTNAYLSSFLGAAYLSNASLSSSGQWTAESSVAAAIGLADVANGNAIVFALNDSQTAGSAWSPTRRMIILPNGNVGIGTTSPGFPLEVNGEVASQTFRTAYGEGGYRITMYHPASNVNRIEVVNQVFELSTTGVSTGNGIRFLPNQTERMRIDGTGNVGIGTSSPQTLLHVAGAVRQAGATSCGLSADANGTLTCTSDERAKDVLGAFPHGLESIQGIAPVVFRYREDSGLAGTFAGFTAQNVGEHIPEAVSVQPDGMLGLDERAIVAALVNGLKEQQAHIDEQQAEIASLRKRLGDVDALSSRMQAMEARLARLGR